MQKQKKRRLSKCLFIGLTFCLATKVVANTDTWVANGDGTVTDVASGLIWQQQDDSIARTQANAITYCQELSLAGNNNWRLPNIKELTSIVDYRAENPSIDAAAFPNTTSSGYWSASNRASSLSAAWAVDFFRGLVLSGIKTSGLYVRCVR